MVLRVIRRFSKYFPKNNQNMPSSSDSSSSDSSDTGSFEKTSDSEWNENNSSESTSSDSDVERPGVTTEQITKNVLKLDKTFVDYVRITVKSGTGGDGCCTYIQPRGFRSKIPAGGNGGKGGDVYIQASHHKRALNMLKNFAADDGEHGKGKDMDGAGGKDIYVKVPLGTQIREINKFGKTRLLASFDTEDSVLIAEGGKGGRGNKEFQYITQKEKGAPGKEKTLELELKLIADIGLVGYPNAGKTSLLAALTRACPKIASYPFTTLQPYVGIIDFIDGYRISVADMPGIIEGAHAGKGLGHEFLKHIQRTKGLVYVLDITQNPGNALITLYNELKLYDSKLIEKPYTVVLNKIDLLHDTSEIEKIFGTKPISISAKYGTGLIELVSHLKEIVKLFD